YDQSLDIDPYCLDAYLGLSDAYMALGQQDKAIEIMEQAKAMLPDSVEVYISLAQLYASREQIDLLVSTLEAGILATNSDRLREMLREYQPGEEAPVQVAESSQEDGDAEEEQLSQTQEDEEEVPSLVIGLEQDNRNQNQAPVLVITRNDEEPARIPLTAPVSQPAPAVSESEDNGTDSNENSGGSSSGGGESQEGGSDSSDGSQEGGSDDNSGTVVEPVLPTTGITGNIYGIDGQGIEGVTISVYSGNSENPVLVNTDNIGKYLQELMAGSYRIVLSKEGYADLSTVVSVVNEALTSSSFVMLTEEESRQSASLKGVAINATDSQGVEGATIVLINGFDNGSNGNQSIIESNKHTTTGSDGRFSIDDDVTAGYYTVEASKDGYSTYIHNETIKPGENDLTINMSPVIQTQGEYRIVLTWGEEPRDLDSHLICTGNDNYHVYFGNKNSSDGNASLDWDDTSSYGPETTTVKIGDGNSYIYAVHNFTNGWTGPGQSGAWNLANSGARVVVYGDDGIIFDGNVPVNKEGTTWEVFRIENGRLVVKNSVSFTHPSDLTGNYS
ncbi:MAG: carboxypeptidase regulatory-like domain-containing protein, partial [Lachnospiraceae bacterium]|nr:carboxypeptidase regulatory-like domain-containing protein [Lachnospiraceae bacterium]